MFLAATASAIPAMPAVRASRARAARASRAAGDGSRMAPKRVRLDASSGAAAARCWQMRAPIEWPTRWARGHSLRPQAFAHRRDQPRQPRPAGSKRRAAGAGEIGAQHAESVEGRHQGLEAVRGSAKAVHQHHRGPRAVAFRHHAAKPHVRHRITFRPPDARPEYPTYAHAEHWPATTMTTRARSSPAIVHSYPARESSTASVPLVRTLHFSGSDPSQSTRHHCILAQPWPCRRNLHQPSASGVPSLGRGEGRGVPGPRPSRLT